MVGTVTRIADHAAEASPWSRRETELLAVTLQLLQEHGYDRLTLDAVAATARASKATVYRRWPTKAELVLAAFVEGIRQVAVAPDTGTLRGDLLQLGDTICAAGPPACRHHPRGARRGVAQPRAQRRNAGPVPRSAKSPDDARPRSRPSTAARSTPTPSPTNCGTCCPATSSTGPSFRTGRPPVTPCKPSSTTCIIPSLTRPKALDAVSASIRCAGIMALVRSGPVPYCQLR